VDDVIARLDQIIERLDRIAASLERTEYGPRSKPLTYDESVEYLKRKHLPLEERAAYEPTAC
jgi:hypothetical protein